MFRTGPLSTIRSFSLYTRQRYMSYRFADSLRAGSGRSSVLILLVRLVTTLRAGWSRNRIPRQPTDFFSSVKRQDRLWDPPGLLNNRYRGALSTEVKGPGHEANHAPPSSAKVRNECSCPSSLSTCLQIVYGGKFASFSFSTPVIATAFVSDISFYNYSADVAQMMVL
jgi:hypothetical protein